MEFSSRLEYALLALLELSDHQADASPLKVCEIAAAQSIPHRYLDQILFALRRGGLVQAQRGVKGGYLLAKDPQQITLLQVMAAVEGESNTSPGRGNTTQTVEKKVVSNACRLVSQALQVVLGCYTLQDLRLQRQRDVDQPICFNHGYCPLNKATQFPVVAPCGGSLPSR
ncbi:MAG: RrF2 family transcriptional regulator [Leptolyngbyaceae cyanobacterium]